MLTGPNIQTTHLNLSSKSGSPSRATYRVWGTNRSDALACVVAAIFHRSIFKADIEVSTLSGHSAIDVTMTPDSNLLLRESIFVHRTPSLHSAMPPISAAPSSPSHHLLQNDAPRRESDKTPSSSDPEDPDLGFPPKHPEPDDADCNDDASTRERHLRRRHRPP